MSEKNSIKNIAEQKTLDASLQQKKDVYKDFLYKMQLHTRNIIQHEEYIEQARRQFQEENIPNLITAIRSPDADIDDAIDDAIEDFQFSIVNYTKTSKALNILVSKYASILNKTHGQYFDFIFHKERLNSDEDDAILTNLVEENDVSESEYDSLYEEESIISHDPNYIYTGLFEEINSITDIQILEDKMKSLDEGVQQCRQRRSNARAELNKSIHDMQKKNELTEKDKQEFAQTMVNLAECFSECRLKLYELQVCRIEAKDVLGKLTKAKNLSAEHAPESAKPQIEHTEVASDHVTPASAVRNTHIREVDVSEEMNPDSSAGDTHSLNMSFEKDTSEISKTLLHTEITRNSDHKDKKTPQK